MKWLSNQFVRSHLMGSFSDFFVDYSGHQENRRAAQLRMLFDEFTKLVSILVGHNNVTDDGIGNGLFELNHGGSHVGAGHHIKVLAAKGDLDDLAHRGTVV